MDITIFTSSQFDKVDVSTIPGVVVALAVDVGSLVVFSVVLKFKEYLNNVIPKWRTASLVSCTQTLLSNNNLSYKRVS